MKEKYLAMYDYGTGGVWLFMYARSPDEIVRKYPELKVVDSKPAWMTDEYIEFMHNKFTFDIDDPPTGWLIEMVNSRNQ